MTTETTTETTAELARLRELLAFVDGKPRALRVEVRQGRDATGEWWSRVLATCPGANEEALAYLVLGHLAPSLGTERAVELHFDDVQCERAKRDALVEQLGELTADRDALTEQLAREVVAKLALATERDALAMRLADAIETKSAIVEQLAREVAEKLALLTSEKNLEAALDLAPDETRYLDALAWVRARTTGVFTTQRLSAAFESTFTPEWLVRMEKECAIKASVGEAPGWWDVVPEVGLDEPIPYTPVEVAPAPAAAQSGNEAEKAVLAPAEGDTEAKVGFGDDGASAAIDDDEPEDTSPVTPAPRGHRWNEYEGAGYRIFHVLQTDGPAIAICGDEPEGKCIEHFVPGFQPPRNLACCECVAIAEGAIEGAEDSGPVPAVDAVAEGEGAPPTPIRPKATSCACGHLPALKRKRKVTVDVGKGLATTHTATECKAIPLPPKCTGINKATRGPCESDAKPGSDFCGRHQAQQLALGGAA